MPATLTSGIRALISKRPYVWEKRFHVVTMLPVYCVENAPRGSWHTKGAASLRTVSLRTPPSTTTLSV